MKHVYEHVLVIQLLAMGLSLLQGVITTSLEAGQKSAAACLLQHIKEQSSKELVRLTPSEDLARFEGPYQTSPQTRTPDALRRALYRTEKFPNDVCNIIASYFFYQIKKPITIHKDKAVETIIKSPTSYAVVLAHANQQEIWGYEFLSSVEKAIGISHRLFKLQEWAYQSNHEEEERFSDGHQVTKMSLYNTTAFDRYTFGIDIPLDYEFEVREQLSRHTQELF